MNGMGELPRATGGPVGTEQHLTRATRIHRAKSRAPWGFSAALRDPTNLDSRTLGRASALVTEATRLGFDALALRVTDVWPVEPGARALIEAARSQRVCLSLALTSNHGTDATLGLIDAWIEAGIQVIDVSETPELSGLVASLLASSDRGQVRSRLVAGPHLSDLDHVLREDWIEITRSSAISQPWTPPVLVSLLSAFYGIHESVGSSPSWDLTPDIVGDAELSASSRVLAALALPGTLTVDVGIADDPVVRGALRFRRELGLEESSLSVSSRPGLLGLYVGGLVVAVNTAERTEASGAGTVLCSTGCHTDGDRLVLEPGSTTWYERRH